MNKVLRQGLASIHHVKSMEQYKTLSASNKSYILNFSAGWCGPCKQMAPILAKKEKQADGKWVLLKVDVDEQGNAQLCSQFNLEGVPTMVFVKDSKDVGTIVGGVDEKTLQDAISKII